MEPEPTALFVYGTLKRGRFNHPLLAPYARAVEPASIRGELYDVGLYPALVAGEGTVRGELVRLAAPDLSRVLTILDWLEDYRPGDEERSMYLRRVIEVHTANGARERAYAYFYNRDVASLPRIAGGEWPGPTEEPVAGDGAGDSAERAAFERHVRTFQAKL
ncbi:MAG: gamma-glutamylcyclotransferase [Chloroflexota bacterium]|nr:gamma-glutamylcyclotransferase [Chloroflexota bacterium]